MRLLFTAAIKKIAPPWLRRIVGGAVMESLADPIETLVDRTTESVKKRFPTDDNDALDYIGRERRIIRGPGETSATYAGRLVIWWDSHRLRGGPYALLEQMFAFFRFTLNTQIDLVNNSGTETGTTGTHLATRYSVDEDGVITRDQLTWNGDGEAPTKWARVFIIFRLETPYLPLSVLVTETGEPILTEEGEEILVETSIYDLTDEDRALLCTVPHEWSAAHIERIYIRLLYGVGDLWGYPEDGTWDENDPAPGPNLWGQDEAVGFDC
jgi:hypothetical protein